MLEMKDKEVIDLVEEWLESDEDNYHLQSDVMLWFLANELAGTNTPFIKDVMLRIFESCSEGCEWTRDQLEEVLRELISTYVRDS